MTAKVTFFIYNHTFLLLSHTTALKEDSFIKLTDFATSI